MGESRHDKRYYSQNDHTVDPYVKKYNHTYTSFSGTDIVATIRIPNYQSFEGYKDVIVGNLQTISYSIHREVTPVRTLGRSNAVGFTAGQRTIAGSMIFTVFDRNLVYEMVDRLKEKDPQRFRAGANYLMDEMPPFDIHIYFKNEYGQQSHLVVEGIVIVDEGQIMSIEDMITENTMSYMARNIQTLNAKYEGDLVTSSSEDNSYLEVAEEEAAKPVVVPREPETVLPEQPIKPNEPSPVLPYEDENEDPTVSVQRDKVQISFVDSKTRMPITRGEIAIYTSTGKWVMTKKLPTSGTLYIYDLNVGKYYYKETLTADGYKPLVGNYAFEIKETGKVHVKTVEKVFVTLLE